MDMMFVVPEAAWNFGERLGLVGNILSYLAGGVPGETGPSGQVNKYEKPFTESNHYVL